MEEGDTSHEGRGRGQNLRILLGKILQMIETQNTNSDRQLNQCFLSIFFGSLAYSKALALLIILRPILGKSVKN